MKNRLIQTVVVAALISGSLSGTYAADSDKEKIHAVIRNYEQVLNASDVAGVVKLYTEDGVFMAQHNPSAVGIGAVKAAYGAVFKAIDLNVAFDIIEIEVVADDWAFARTNSVGTTTIKATRSCLSFKRPTTASGRLRDTASPPPIHVNRSIQRDFQGR